MRVLLESVEAFRLASFPSLGQRSAGATACQYSRPYAAQPHKQGEGGPKMTNIPSRVHRRLAGRKANRRRKPMCQPPATEEAGVPWCGWHTLRHTCASVLFDEGRNAL